jgi:LmbE family N-acetylglucosaminyl deacetylase
MNKKILSGLLFLLFAFSVGAQAPKKPNSGEIHDAIKKLTVLGSVLYVAAHPDDENTRLISYMASERKYQTTYLSLTRGDGGQNLIGSELREYLGVLRTQELLMARGVDGGMQRFSRANDFGFSKNADETLNIWNKEETLADLVWTIRKTQPDVVINRFSTDKSVDTHGHHTASAILSDTAFDLAGRADAFPEQLKFVAVWQPKRLFFNTSWFFYGSKEKFDKADKSDQVAVDMGIYLPTKGKSNNEIAAESRSMHKCQGMGTSGIRGSENEYLKFLKGSAGQPKVDLFDGINTTWSRVEGGEAIGKLLADIDAQFKYDNPSASVKDLIRIKKMIAALPNDKWRTIKLAEINDIIKWCSGIYLEATAKDYSITPSQEMEMSIEAINRSNGQVKLMGLSFVYMSNLYKPANMLLDTILNNVLKNNARSTLKVKVKIPNTKVITEYSSPYWLNKKGTMSMYRVDDQPLIGLPETPRPLVVIYNLEIEGEQIFYTLPVAYKFDNPAKGEIYRPFEVLPPVFTNIVDKVYVFADDKSKPVTVLVKAGKDKLKGSLKLQMPTGWVVTPASIPFEINSKNDNLSLIFTVTPPQVQNEAEFAAIATVDGDDYSKSVRIIEYDHIPTQTVLQDATAKVVKLDIKKKGKNVAYFMGAGDDVPSCLEQIGYTVTLIDDRDFNNLARFDAVVMGIRAYNTKDKLKFLQPKLMEYVNNGGNLIVQYNNNGRDLVTEDLGPYPLTLSRERVTVEEAPVRFLKPDHAVLNFPNKINAKDFEGWVQERGLYFPSKWDARYEAILSCNDPNEPARDGGLLVANYGKGHYIYTGYAWFRELPAGVPGAYRLFANMISLGLTN